MKKYTVYWLDGTREVIEGNDIPHALMKAGYGQGAVPAIDFIRIGEDNSYSWIDGKWIKNQE